MALKPVFRTSIFMTILTTFLQNTTFRSIMTKICWMWPLFLFLIRYFVVLFTINCDQMDIVVGRFLKAHLFNGFSETTRIYFWYPPTHWVVSLKPANFWQFFWNLGVVSELEFGRKWLKARFQWNLLKCQKESSTKFKKKKLPKIRYFHWNHPISRMTTKINPRWFQ